MKFAFRVAPGPGVMLDRGSVSAPLEGRLAAAYDPLRFVGSVRINTFLTPAAPIVILQMHATTLQTGQTAPAHHQPQQQEMNEGRGSALVLPHVPRRRSVWLFHKGHCTIVG